MKFRFAAAVGSVALFLAATGAEPQAGVVRPDPAIDDTPKLVVMLAVDQLGEELLERAAPYLTGGLGRLLRDGAWYTNAWVDHAVTVSHPGHVTLSTGMDPADHGIVDAAFYTGPPGARRFTDALADSTETVLDGRGTAGVSPRRIRVSGLWDWAMDIGARRVAVGTGRFSSVLYARSPGDVYWFDRAQPGYVTSTFYRRRLPDWVVRFNEDTLPSMMADTAWLSTVPDSIRFLARRDSAAYETGGLHPAFPHRFHGEIPEDRRSDPRALAWWFAGTPMLDGVTLALARAAVADRQLGQGEGTDVLVVVLSQIDDIGHWYGPRSLEQLDALWRLDRELGVFLDFLDETVGEDQYVLALSADHSAPAAPEYRTEQGHPVGRVTAAEVEAADSAANAAAEAAGQDPDARARAVVDVLEALPWVADAMTPADLLADADTGAFIRLYRHSYAPGRVPRYPLFSFRTGESAAAREGVAVRLDRDVMLDLDTSVHGSPYRYDRWVPIVLYGAGVVPGCRTAEATTKDVAPTLARLGGIPVPESVTGRALEVGASARRGACP